MPEKPPKLREGEIVANRWKVSWKLGEGGFGAVYLVRDMNDGEREAALKVESVAEDPRDDLIGMEVRVLRRLQTSEHACRLLQCGTTTNSKHKRFHFFAMSLLGMSLSELRRETPMKRLTTSTAVRIGIQAVRAVQDVHIAGFIHRDLKPCNFAMGDGDDRRRLFLLDFGMARQYFMKNDNNGWFVRLPRTNVLFRGTPDYASPNVHCEQEQGRHDDLWSLMYILIELISGTLPWRSLSRKEIGTAKMAISDYDLFAECPHKEFARIMRHIKTLNYYKRPNYDFVRDQLEAVMTRKRYSYDDPFDWEEGGMYEDWYLNARKEEEQLQSADGNSRSNKTSSDSDEQPSESDGNSVRYGPNAVMPDWSDDVDDTG